MRVSNTVKDYIYSEINKRCPVEDLPEYTVVVDALRAFDEELGRKIQALVDAEITSFTQANHVVPNDILHGYFDNSYHDSSYGRNIIRLLRGTEIQVANNEHLMKQNKIRSEACTRIIATLELGGNKADLEQMLSELG